MRDPKERLREILEAIAAIERHLGGDKAAFERDEDYRRLNALILRNTSVINFLDGCAATVPIPSTGAPVGADGRRPPRS